YMVYSEEAKNIGVQECNVPAENITVIPFLMNEKFHKQISTEEKNALRKKLGFAPNKKMVLLVGGGEGLPGATEIINNCIINRADFAITVICGRDKVKMRNLKLLRLAHPKLDLHIYGFVNNLDELVKICDCAVIKAGPATLMEVLSCRKPVIICKYIHNQELGNMRFAVKNKVGYFIRKPRKIYKKINHLLNDSQFDEKMKERFESVVIDTDSNKVAKLLLEK
ncbi:MAG: glycosyltransferase, partial [Treponemataceae bacterium]|nr:glycosyltransferase [Treponemataceae bacterium]